MRSAELRERLVSLCPDLYKEAFRQALFNDLVILRLTSCKYRVLVDKIGKSSWGRAVSSSAKLTLLTQLAEALAAVCQWWMGGSNGKYNYLSPTKAGAGLSLAIS